MSGRTRAILFLSAALAMCSGFDTAVSAGAMATNSQARLPQNDTDLQFWLRNMLQHRFTIGEMVAATGVSSNAIVKALSRGDATPFSISNVPGETLLVLPYPGGRHPRIGFLDGAVDPQRETKFSVFTPWDAHSYVVVDVPEAIWSNLGLTYLAHTHVPTLWTERGLELPRLEWLRSTNGTLTSERILPNGMSFGARVIPQSAAVQMELWLRNGTSNTLRQLRVQNCVMLKGAPGFSALTDTNKHFAAPFIATHSEDRRQWIITAWTPHHRLWANPPVPCMHADPQFPDCPPGETVRLRGWLSFYEGRDIDQEITRIRQSDWLLR